MERPIPWVLKLLLPPPPESSFDQGTQHLPPLLVNGLSLRSHATTSNENEWDRRYLKWKNYMIKMLISKITWTDLRTDLCCLCLIKLNYQYCTLFRVSSSLLSPTFFFSVSFKPVQSEAILPILYFKWFFNRQKNKFDFNLFFSFFKMEVRLMYSVGIKPLSHGFRWGILHISTNHLTPLIS